MSSCDEADGMEKRIVIIYKNRSFPFHLDDF